MLHISLFSGIGGFDLAAHWLGWTNIVSCEINDFGNKVLEHYWPDAYHHRDVKTLTLETINQQLGDGWRTDDVILTGGFPCQPYSSAGKRKGKEDERHLWPEMLRVIREIKPSYIVGENVAGLLSWSGGLVFEEVHADLEAEGYEVQAVVIPAAAVNAPHGRDRVWFIAKNTNDNGRGSQQRQEESRDWKQRNISAGNNERLSADNDKIRTPPHSNNPRNTTSECGTDRECKKEEQKRYNTQRELSGFEYNGDVANTELTRLEHGSKTRNLSSEKEKTRRERCQSSNELEANGNGNCNFTDTNGIGLWGESDGIGKSGFVSKNEPRNNWKTFPSVSPVCSRDDGISHQLDGITFSKWRKESIKAAGNAVVPQVVYEIFKAINATRK